MQHSDDGSPQKMIFSPAFFALHCTDAEGLEVVLNYSPYKSSLVDQFGTNLLSDTDAADFAVSSKVAPNSPGLKVNTPRVLKIQLGLNCNYACSYCSQASEVGAGVVTKTADADGFLSSLDDWLEDAPERIEFWGGEPFLYFAKLKKLVPALRERFPCANFSIFTNGSLLNEEILAFIETYDIYVAVSHDGPGQHLRGPDPFDDVESARWLKDLWVRRGRTRHRVSFFVVLTPANADVTSTGRWLATKLGDENLMIDTEGAASVYDEKTRVGAGQWSQTDYNLLHQSIVDGFIDGQAMKFRGIAHKARDFIESLKTQRPASALGQKCGMDDPSQLAVDLQGNVMTCQNTGAKGKHKIGHVNAMREVRLDTATHWSHRESCNYCPVLQLCKGSCMFLNDDLFAQSCENEYHYNMAILAGVIKSVTGLTLKSASGDIRRPKVKRVIPLIAV